AATGGRQLSKRSAFDGLHARSTVGPSRSALGTLSRPTERLLGNVKTPLLVALACIPLATPVHAAPTAVPIIRDRWGVPHVFVPTSIGNRVAQLRALGTTFGYAMARDRMYLLERSRRTTTGHLAELPCTGRAFLEGDVAIRRDRLTDAERRAAVQRLPSRLRIIVEGFGDGVNRYLDE